MSADTAVSPVATSGRHILIIKLGALGDVMLAIPLIKQLLRHHPGDRVTLLTTPAWRELVAGLPALETVTFARRGTASMVRLLSWLLRQSFDVVYDLQGSSRSRLVTLLSQAPLRAGPVAALAYTHAPANESGEVTHALQRFNAVLAAAGVEVAAALPALPAGAAADRQVEGWLRGHGLHGKRLVLLHAGGSPAWPSKRWPEQHFLALAQQLIARGMVVVWLGEAGERDLNRRLSVAGVDATGEFSLVQLAALGRHARFAVCNDSGPMHVLAAAAVPVYAFFGPTDWRRSHALGQQHRVLWHAVACSPCYLKLCPPQRRHACLQELLPEQVLNRFVSDGLL